MHSKSSLISEMKPQFDLSKTIDGSRSLREFSLKKYKHLSKLKVVKLINTRNLAAPAPILQKLSVSVQSLDLSQYDCLETYSTPQIKLLAKKFQKITRLSLLGNKNSTKDLLLALNMLRKAKNLLHLSLKDVFDESLPDQILHLISQSKLKTINLIPTFSMKTQSTSLLSFSNYCPSTVEELSLYWKNQKIPESRARLSLNHLAHLQKLELGMPLALETFQCIIESIPDPSKLRTLQFHIASKKKPSPSGIQQAFLEDFSNLEELSIQTSLDVYPKNSNMKLKKLSIASTENLLGSINFIQQQKETLESLCLTSKVGVHSPRNELLEGLKPLKRLKKLKLNVKFEMSNVNALDLAQLIEALECIEEMDVMDMSVLFSESGFSSFCQALQKRSGTLRSLRVSLHAFSLNQKDSNFFIQTLKLLSGLEHITLKDFGIEDPSFFNELREIVCCRSKNLNEVILETVKREKTAACCENVIEMLKDIIHKPTMKKLCYLEAAKCGYSSDFKDLGVLSLFNVLKEVHHFDHLHLPSYICKPSFFYWNLSWHKWMENLN